MEERIRRLKELSIPSIGFISMIEYVPEAKELLLSIPSIGFRFIEDSRDGNT